MLTPHTGEVRGWICGRELRLRFTWRALSRLEALHGTAWMDKLAAAVEKFDAREMAMLAECASDDQIWITPAFALGQDDGALVLASMIQGALGAAFEGPGKAGDDDEAESDDAPKDPGADWIERAYGIAHQIGIGETFWDITPYQMRIAARGFEERAQNEQRIAITAAWLNAGLQRTKRIPPLEQVLGGRRGSIDIPDDATADEAVEALKAGWGGAT